MVSSLRGGVLLVVILNSKHFVESAAIAFMKGVLFLPFAMQFDCFFRPMVESPGGSKWVIGIRVYDSIKESFLQSFFKESYGADVVEWYSSISSNSFEV
jgi:hypothetical protein